jgi:hypothetical protein
MRSSTAIRPATTRARRSTRRRSARRSQPGTRSTSSPAKRPLRADFALRTRSVDADDPRVATPRRQRPRATRPVPTRRRRRSVRPGARTGAARRRAHRAPQPPLDLARARGRGARDPDRLHAARLLADVPARAVHADAPRRPERSVGRVRRPGRSQVRRAMLRPLLLGRPRSSREDVAYWTDWVARRMQHVREMVELVDLFIAPLATCVTGIRDEFGLPARSSSTWTTASTEPPRGAPATPRASRSRSATSARTSRRRASTTCSRRSVA